MDISLATGGGGRSGEPPFSLMPRGVWVFGCGWGKSKSLAMARALPLFTVEFTLEPWMDPSGRDQGLRVLTLKMDTGIC